MTDQNRRDLSAEELATGAVEKALADADLQAKDIKLVISANALGGELCDQGCIRGQSWLRKLGFGSVGVVNVENACAGGVNAAHIGSLAALAGESPILVVATEKMWTGDRKATMEAIEEGVPAAIRKRMKDLLGNNPSRSLFMGLNAKWAKDLLASGATTIKHLVATSVKARFHGSLNPLAQHRIRLTEQEIMEAQMVVEPLTRPMCSSFTDGAAALVLTTENIIGAPRILASVLGSGDGTGEYHSSMALAAQKAYEESGYGPDDFDVIEIHDATSAEELLALECLGFYPPGKAGAATGAGDTTLGGSGVTVNPSGGLVARGHPIGATGACQLVELVDQLKGRAGGRQVDDARLALAVNTGGIIEEDVASVGVMVLGRG